MVRRPGKGPLARRYGDRLIAALDAASSCARPVIEAIVRGSTIKELRPLLERAQQWLLGQVVEREELPDIGWINIYIKLDDERYDPRAWLTRSALKEQFLDELDQVLFCPTTASKADEIRVADIHRTVMNNIVHNEQASLSVLFNNDEAFHGHEVVVRLADGQLQATVNGRTSPLDERYFWYGEAVFGQLAPLTTTTEAGEKVWTPSEALYVHLGLRHQRSLPIDEAGIYLMIRNAEAWREHRGLLIPTARAFLRDIVTARIWHAALNSLKLQERAVRDFSSALWRAQPVLVQLAESSREMQEAFDPLALTKTMLEAAASYLSEHIFPVERQPARHNTTDHLARPVEAQKQTLADAITGLDAILKRAKTADLSRFAVRRVRDAVNEAHKRGDLRAGFLAAKALSKRSLRLRELCASAPAAARLDSKSSRQQDLIIQLATIRSDEMKFFEPQLEASTDERRATWLRIIFAKPAGDLSALRSTLRAILEGSTSDDWHDFARPLARVLRGAFAHLGATDLPEVVDDERVQLTAHDLRVPIKISMLESGQTRVFVYDADPEARQRDWGAILAAHAPALISWQNNVEGFDQEPSAKDLVICHGIGADDGVLPRLEGLGAYTVLVSGGRQARAGEVLRGKTYIRNAIVESPDDRRFSRAVHRFVQHLDLTGEPLWALLESTVMPENLVAAYLLLCCDRDPGAYEVRPGVTMQQAALDEVADLTGGSLATPLQARELEVFIKEQDVDIPCPPAGARGQLHHSVLKNAILKQRPATLGRWLAEADHLGRIRRTLEELLETFVEGYGCAALVDTPPFADVASGERDAIKRCLNERYEQAFNPAARHAELQAAVGPFLEALEQVEQVLGGVDEVVAARVEALKDVARGLYAVLSRLPNRRWLP